LSIFIIAEAGINHNGNPKTAFQLVDVAADAGADAVKFQTFKTEELVTDYAKTADYQKKSLGKNITQYELLKKLELSYELHFELHKYCKQKNIAFMSTAFDNKSLNFLVNDLGLKTLKISSGDITNTPFLLEHARTGLDLILSTGISTLDEIEEALSVIAFGLTNRPESMPNQEKCKQAYSSKVGQQALKDKVTLLHCVSEYPAPNTELNLNAINTLRNHFQLSIGYSDHSQGAVVPIAAVALGAVIIEKHFTLDRKMVGPDHLASIEPLELSSMITSIRLIEEALGDGVKQPSTSEIKNKDSARKSIVAIRNITKGDIYTEENIAVRRPGSGMPPNKYWDLLGSLASSSVQAGQYIDE